MINFVSEQHNPKGLESTAGRLVWVQRKNGSWWPGQIMDVNESCFDAGKSSGVPIKLLGRDDINVEWYNLEEAKQVKPFRCGDHKSCIEKAKKLQANSSTRRLKRTQRENAIIIALELETALMITDCDENFCGADNTGSEPCQSLSTASSAMCYPSRVIDSPRNTSSSKDNSDSAPKLSLEKADFPEKCPDKAKRKRTVNHSEDDDNEGVKKRMRGLDDVVVRSNMKRLNGLVTEPASQGLSSLGELCPFNRLPIKNIMNGSSGVCMAYFKKKRSKVVFQEILKQEDSIDLLTKVLQSDTLVSVPIIYDELLSPCKSSYSDDKVSVFESKRSVSDANLCCNAHNNQDYALTISKLKDYDLSRMPELLGYDSSDNLFDVLLISEEELFDGFPPRITRSSMKTNEGKIESRSAKETEKDPLVWQLKGKRNRRRQNRNPELDCKMPTDSKADLSDPEDELDRHEILEPSITQTNVESLVYDVHIEVEASYRPQRVPNVSLMSILNRAPVSGHPISVEVVEDGESDFLSDHESTEARTRSSKTQKHGSLIRKTRTLSSLVESRTKEPPTSACIPIEVVFSRIDEALNGSTSTVNRIS